MELGIERFCPLDTFLQGKWKQFSIKDTDFVPTTLQERRTMKQKIVLHKTRCVNIAYDSNKMKPFLKLIQLAHLAPLQIKSHKVLL